MKFVEKIKNNIYQANGNVWEYNSFEFFDYYIFQCLIKVIF